MTTRIAPALAIIALFAWALWQRWSFLDSSPFPLGVDGYYYPIQLRSLLEHGELHYPSAPLAFWLMAPLVWLSDPITGAKLGAALGTSLIVWPAYLLGRRIGGTRATGILAATLVATSPSSFYFSAEFVKNGIGLTLALGFLCVLARALEGLARCDGADLRTGQRSTVWLAAAVVWFLAVVMTHKLATFVAVVAALPPVIALVAGRWRAGGPAKDRLLRPGWLVAVLLAPVVAVVALGLAAPERFPSPGDLGLASELLTAEPDWSLPVLAPPGAAPLTMQGEVAIAALLSIAALVLWRLTGQRADHPGPQLSWFLGLAVMSLIIALPWLAVSDPQGPGFRLRLLGFIPLALSAAAVTGPVLRRLSPVHRGIAITAFALAFILARPARPQAGIARAHPAMVSAAQTVSPLVPRHHTIVTPERHILFMVAWYGDREVVLRPERIAEDQRWRLLPMALMTPALRQAIDQARTDAPAGIPPPRGVHPMHRNGLVVMPELTWQWILARLPPADRALYRRWQTI